MKTTVKASGKKRRAKPRIVPPFPFEFRIKVAKLREEEGYPVQMLAEQFGISEYSVYRWAKIYRDYGQRGLEDQPKKPSRATLPAVVTQSIIDLKKQDPAAWRIAVRNWLERHNLIMIQKPKLKSCLASW